MQMKTKKSYPSLILTITVLAMIALTSMFCSRNPKVVPEISGNLFDQDILDLTGKSLPNTLLSHQGELVLVDIDGKITRWNPDEKIVNDLYNLNRKVDPSLTPYQCDNYLMLKTVPSQAGADATNPEYVVFNLKEMKETAVLKDIGTQKLLGLDGEIVVYTTPTQEAIIFNYHTKTPLETLKPTLETKQVNKEDNKEESKKNSPDPFLNCEYSGDDILVLSSRTLYVYNRIQKNLSAFPLKHPAASGFLKVGDWIYYGSLHRELIKLSIRSQRVDWHFLLAETLHLPPTMIGQYIVIIPEDNNIYFFNKNGNLFWWEQLHSTKRTPVLTMKENVVVFLMDKRIKFFNYTKKRVTTYTLPEWMNIKSNPLTIGEHIYVVTQDKVEVSTEVKAEDELGTPENQPPTYTRLSKIGNNYTVEITTEPEFIWLKGKSIKFDLTNINFVRPRYTIQIFKNPPADKPGTQPTQPVFTRFIGLKDKPSFVWVPEELAEYRMLIQIDADNKKGVTVEKTISTIDINKTLHDYYYEIQRQCGSTGKTETAGKKSSGETK